MRAYILYIILLLPLSMLCQQEVTLAEVKMASVHYISVQNPYRMPYSLSDIDTVSYLSGAGGAAIYETLFEDGNSVLLSGTKACIPILGYNLSGTGESVVLGDNVPYGLQAMLNDMIMEIDSCLLNDTITLYHATEWSELLSANYLQTKSRATRVGPLTISRWGQSKANDSTGEENEDKEAIHAYNYCVTETNSACGNEKYCPAGCVAVAMAQILHYWKHPMNKGFRTYYDWCNMPDLLLFYNNPNFELQRNAVARLIDDCGKTASMNYCILNTCESFAWPLERLGNVFSAAFNLNSGIEHKWRMWHKRKWVGMLKDNINNGWPVMYAGVGNIVHGEAHSFICDGYDSDDNFHFNWGWNGYCNGAWLTLKKLRPGNGDNYSNLQNAIFNIRPNTSYVDYCEAVVNLPVHYALYQSHGGYDFWNIVPPTGRVLESCDQSLPSAWRTIPSGESSEYTAFERVVLNPGFTAEEGSNFVASIRECPNCNGTIMLKSGKQGTEPENGKELSDGELLTGTEQSDTDGISVYPNPTTGEIIIKTAGMVEHGEIQVINGLGSVIRTEKINGNPASINLSELPNGIYYLMITIEGKTASRKIIKQ